MHRFGPTDSSRSAPAPRDGSDVPRGLPGLVDLVYAAAVEPAQWPSFLRGLGAATGSDVVPFVVWDYAKRDGQCLRVYPLDETAMREYRAWAPHNPYVRQSPRLRTGEIRIIHPSEPAIRTSAFYNEWLGPRLGVGHNLGMTVFSDPTMSVQLSPLRDPKKPPYGRRETELLRRLGPHLRRAITIEQKLMHIETRQSGISEALDRAPTAVVLLDGRGSVIFFNQEARDMLDQRDGLMLDGRGFLTAARPVEQTRLKRVVAEACATGMGRGMSAGGALRVSRPSDRRAFQLIVSPLRHRTPILTPFAPSAIVFASEPDRLPASTENVLHELYDLTPAEVRVARLLGEGYRVSEIAEALALRPATIRTHVKRLLEKTDSRSQADLMRILCATPMRSRANDRARAPRRQ